MNENYFIFAPMGNYSKSFERDYDFYLKNINEFIFCGTLNHKHVAIYYEKGKTAKESFYSIDTKGINIPTREPDMLNKILNCKASVNFAIKQWAESRADGTLSMREFSGNGKILEWKVSYIEGIKDCIPIYYKNMIERYNLPYWVINAVESQKNSIIKNNPNVYTMIPSNK